MLKKMKKAVAAFGVAAASAAGALAAPQDAQATTITWEGTLDATGGTLAGETIPFSLQIQSDAVDQNPDPERGLYPADSLTVDLPASAGGPVTFLGPDTSVLIADNAAGGALDSIVINMDPPTGPDLLSLSVSTLNTSLFLSDALPQPLPPFSSFENGRPFGLTVGSHTAWGEVSSLQQVVPEPGTGALLGLGLGALAAARRRRGPVPS